MRLFGKRSPFTKQVGIESPMPQPNRHGVAIATMLKNEESYIEEWLAFHHAVGVRHFILYDNGSTDRTAEIIRTTLAPGEFTLVPWAGRMTDAGRGQPFNSQVMAFAHAIVNFGPEFRWLAIIDVDEFLFPKVGNTVEEALEAVNGFPNVTLPWHMFGPGGHRTRPEGGLLRNYIYRAKDPISRKNDATNFKCIVDPCEVTEVSVHQFQTRQYGELTCNDRGHIFSRKQRKRPEFYSSANLQLNHYYTKSVEEFEQKIQRGPASPGTRERYETRLRAVLESIAADVVEDRQIVEFIDRNNIRL